MPVEYSIVKDRTSSLLSKTSKITLPVSRGRITFGFFLEQNPPQALFCFCGGPG